MKKNLLFLFVIMLFYSSCGFDEQDLTGIYTPVSYNKTYDTIIIKTGGLYSRKVYNKKGEIVLKTKGKWTFYDKNHESIHFQHFFLNLDRDLSKYPKLTNDTLGGGSFNLEKTNGTIQFCVGHYSASLSNQNCYIKQRDN